MPGRCLRCRHATQLRRRRSLHPGQLRAQPSGCQHTIVADRGSCSIVIPGGENKKSDCYVFADVAGTHPIKNPKTLDVPTATPPATWTAHATTCAP